jgi:hypothetical protein
MTLPATISCRPRWTYTNGNALHVVMSSTKIVCLSVPVDTGLPLERPRHLATLKDCRPRESGSRRYGSLYIGL